MHTRNKLFAVSSLPAQTKALPTDGLTDQRTNGPTDGRTHPFIVLWLTTINQSASETSLYTQNEWFTVSSLPAETKAFPTDEPTDQWTNGLTDWLTIKKPLQETSLRS